MRYEKIQINDIRQGSGQIYHKEGSRAFYDSKGIDIDFVSGRARLAQALEGKKHTGFEQNNLYGNLICRHVSGGVLRSFYLMHNTAGGANGLELWGGTTLATYAIIKDWTSTYSEAYYLLEYKNKLIGQYLLVAGALVKIGYSVDDGVNFTEATWTYGKIQKHVIDQDGLLWVITSSGYIVSTPDGITWTVRFSSATENYADIAYLDGFIYLIVSDLSSKNSVFARIENDQIKRLYQFNSNNFLPAMITQDDERIVIAVWVREPYAQFLAWSKGGMTEIGFWRSAYSGQHLKFIAGNRYAVYLLAGNTLVKINKSNGIFYLYLSTEYTGVANMVFLNAVLRDNSQRDSDLVIYSMDGVNGDIYILNQQLTTTLATGVYTTSVIDEGEHVPAYLILKCPPQLATTTITVKAKKNKESTFATTILISHTTGRVRETIALKDLIPAKLDYIQFEITLADTAGDSTGPQEIEIGYLYTPTGVENSL